MRDADVIDYEGGCGLGPSEKELDAYRKSMKKLKIVSCVSIFFIICQCIGGYLANSIAIFTDTAHLGTDMIGFVISMIALKMSLRPASNSHTFGWARAEIIGTLISVIFLMTITIWLFFEATGRV
jgi:zinc transporter 2